MKNLEKLANFFKMNHLWRSSFNAKFASLAFKNPLKWHVYKKVTIVILDTPLKLKLNF